MKTNENNALKNPIRVTQLDKSYHGRGFTSVDLRGGELVIDPYLILTEFNMSQPFFPPHPHAGVSVATYIFPDSAGSFINRDSLGDQSRIEPGGLHLTQAGIGMHHEEIPEVPGQNVHGMQIWINHSVANRLSEARAYHAKSADIQEVITDMATVRVLFGSFSDADSVIKPLTPVRLLDVYIKPNGTLTIPFEEGQSGVLIVIVGDGFLNDTHSLAAQTAAGFDSTAGDITLTAGASGLQVLITSGTPLNEPIVFGGPFVMNTADQLLETKRRYGRGEMGTLAPSF